MRLLLKEPRSTLSWHRDPEPRLHIPIYTNPGAIMVVDNVAKHMPADGSVWITNNTKYHNAFNGCLLYTSPSPRDGRISRMPSSA